MKCFKPLNRAFQAATTTYPMHSHSLRSTCYLQALKRPQKEDLILERCILNPERAETCQSGTDDEVGRHKSPYDPSKTEPDKEHLALEEEYRLEGDTIHDPLFFSPVNRDVSRPVDPMAGVHGLQHLRSAKGWTRKRKKALLRTAPYEMRKYENVFSEIRKPHQKVCF
ncbi:hypothetical protein N7472_004008 [Penicillium cf. griseofulvum]|uniref:Uncharacterized protein n=1 Tax=Penicillium cf. griseofulvum TaxID=2972120 RepID=A0A9W9T3S0_9EURO|nr:hypothetical protein N7472_006938 [Penicillium cf. griseofulvum]KAJ5207560.1 hypothetical protein N7472_004008 [Penicillium cf. griseofulvum]KAJ5447450.1 hypothetical protein N7445_002271 [Penicillium cf. griseofulvum]